MRTSHIYITFLLRFISNNQTYRLVWSPLARHKSWLFYWILKSVGRRSFHFTFSSINSIWNVNSFKDFHSFGNEYLRKQMAIQSHHKKSAILRTSKNATIYFYDVDKEGFGHDEKNSCCVFFLVRKVINLYCHTYSQLIKSLALYLNNKLRMSMKKIRISQVHTRQGHVHVCRNK